MPGREALSDAALLAASAAGDAAAFTGFVERHQWAALGYLRLLAADPAAIEDALQEAFLAAWRSAGEFRGGDSARSWQRVCGGTRCATCSAVCTAGSYS